MSESDIDTDSHHFCVLCFADNVSGSWGHTTVPGFCSNCGASGSTIVIPPWAVERIRKNASWVGRRYYPSDEDKALGEELRALRRLPTYFWGRAVEPGSEAGRWNVQQKLHSGMFVMVFIDAASAADALEIAKDKLPFVAAPPSQDQAPAGNEGSER